MLCVWQILQCMWTNYTFRRLSLSVGKMPFVLLLLGAGEIQIILKHTSLHLCTKILEQPLAVTLPLDHHHHRLMHIISTPLHGGSVLRFRCLKIARARHRFCPSPPPLTLSVRYHHLFCTIIIIIIITITALPRRRGLKTDTVSDLRYHPDPRFTRNFFLSSVLYYQSA